MLKSNPLITDVLPITYQDGTVRHLNGFGKPVFSLIHGHRNQPNVLELMLDASCFAR